MRDCPYGICFPWVRGDGTWMLWENSSVAAVALARFFLDKFSKKSSFLVIFHQKLTFWYILFLKIVFSPKNFRQRHASPSFSAFIFEIMCIFYQKVIIFRRKLTCLVKNCHFWSKTDILDHCCFKDFFPQEFSPKARLPVV